MPSDRRNGDPDSETPPAYKSPSTPPKPFPPPVPVTGSPGLDAIGVHLHYLAARVEDAVDAAGRACDIAIRLEQAQRDDHRRLRALEKNEPEAPPPLPQEPWQNVIFAKIFDVCLQVIVTALVSGAMVYALAGGKPTDAVKAAVGAAAE